jgi:hypothetical protein
MQGKSAAAQALAGGHAGAGVGAAGAGTKGLLLRQIEQTKRELATYVAEGSMSAEDAYKTWRNAQDARAAIGDERLTQAGETAFARLVEPELGQPPVV